VHRRVFGAEEQELKARIYRLLGIEQT
jgi:hypothetical protein